MPPPPAPMPEPSPACLLALRVWAGQLASDPDTPADLVPIAARVANLLDLRDILAAQHGRSSIDSNLAALVGRLILAGVPAPD